MTETTNKEASTLHRLLEIGKIDEDSMYKKITDYEGAPIDADLIIVDEMSMVDMFLMNCLLKCIYQGTKTNISRRRRPITISRSGKCIKRFHTF